MNAALRLSLDELLVSLKRKRIPIQFEIGTFVVLAACEAVIDNPVRVGCSDLSIDDEGHVLVSESAEKATAEESARALIEILCDLLLASAPGIPDVLLQLVEHGPSDRRYTLARLKEDLEAALVPLNRSATKRVLARLVREAKQEGERQVEQPQFVISRAALDDEFDTLFGRSKNGASPSSSAAVDSDKHDSDSVRSVPIRFESELHQGDSVESDPEIGPDRLTTRYNSYKDDRRSTDRSRDSVDDFVDIKEQTKEKGSTTKRLALAVLALFLLVVGYFVFTGLDDDDTQSSAMLDSLTTHPALESTTSKQTPPLEKASPSIGILRVNSTPSLAQVMLYLGHGHARLERVPLGVAHEFVAIAQGYAPLRTVLAADTKWQIKEEVPYTTLAMTLTPRKAQRSASGLGSTQLPQQHDSASGRLGTVEIRTDPREAAIYQLVGFTPDLAIESLSADKPIRLLVYAAGYRAEQIEIKPAHWIEREGKLSAEVEAKLKRNRSGGY